MKTARQHYDAINAARLAVEAADLALVQARRAAAFDLCQILPGMHVPGKTSSGGISCTMEVAEVFADTNHGSLSITIHGHKVIKDGTTGIRGIECYMHDMISIDQ